jgi:pimeloyl-ACP methyl ester carboxylesterase
MPRHVTLGGIDAMADPSVWTEDPIAVPLLVLAAGQGMAATRSTTEDEALVRRLAPTARYQVWDGVSHFFPMEHADRLATAVRAWLDALPDTGSRGG